MRFPFAYRVVEQPARQTNLLRTLLLLRMGTRSINSLPADQLLVRMHMAPFNPSDIAFLQGNYNVKKPLPAVPGFEGAGLVVAVGEGVDKVWIGKRVACFAGNQTDGTWAEYLLASENQILAIDEHLSWEQAATFLVNPFTAYAMFDRALQQGCGAIALNAAGSSVAHWMRQFAARNNIEIINFVRKSETKAQLMARGCRHVLVSADEGCVEEFHLLAQRLDCRIAFDAVAGPMGAQLLNAMPNHSTLVVYGGLSNQPLGGLEVLGLIFGGKKVEGFDLNQWWAMASAQLKQSVAGELSQLMRLSGNTFPVAGVVDMQHIVEGLKQYLGHMSDGKVLLRLA